MDRGGGGAGKRIQMGMGMGGWGGMNGMPMLFLEGNLLNPPPPPFPHLGPACHPQCQSAHAYLLDL